MHVTLVRYWVILSRFFYPIPVGLCRRSVSTRPTWPGPLPGKLLRTRQVWSDRI